MTKNIYYSIFISLILFASVCIVTAQNASVSVLNEGTYYKVSVDAKGVYKLDESFFSKIPNIGSINPKSISIYGGKGGILPERIAEDRLDDLVLIPTLFIGNDDTNLSADEAFYFYAPGADEMSYDATGFEHRINPYHSKSYYFICVDCGESKPITPEQNNTIPQIQAFDYDDYQYHEKELVNLLGSNFGTQGTGKMWFGEDFTHTRTQEFKQYFDLDKIVDGSKIVVTAQMAARSGQTTKGQIKLNEKIVQQNISPVNFYGSYARFASLQKWRLQDIYNGSIDRIELSMINHTPPFLGWLDFVSLHTIKRLAFNGTEHFIRYIRDADSVSVDFHCQGLTDHTQIWRVSDPLNIHQINHDGVQFVGNGMTEYVLFDPNQINRRPQFESAVPNQNLHGLFDAEYVLIYPAIFEKSAHMLAEHRASHSDLQVYAIAVENIFNEFASGSPDPTAIRDFLRMLHVRNPQFQFACLFGDGTYDYRGLSPALSPDNYIPTYQTDNSVDPITGFTSDDYYALLSEHEGGNGLKGGLDIAIGRIPVSSPQEAQVVVNKIIQYDKDPSMNGPWKNNFILIADDEEYNGFLNQSVRLENEIKQKYPVANRKPIYLDAFSQISTTGDARYPGVKQQINDFIEQGALVVNYYGHGGPSGFAQERVLELQDILSWKNIKRLPLFITATCTFTAFDDAALKSGGELALISPTGGCVALVSTTRAVTISANERLVQAFTEFLFQQDDRGFLPLGEVMRLAKNNHHSDTSQINARKFSLFGDPAMQLAFPKNQVMVNSLTKSIDGSPADTIGALEKVRIEGMVTDRDSQLLQEFNGEVQVILQDKVNDIKTLGNDPTSIQTTFKAYTTTLFKGTTQVINGRFELEFVLPKDINYSYGNGRISLYASQPHSMVDAAGCFEDFIIGGTNDSDISDNMPPVIQMYMNNRSFVSGDRTGPSPLFIADITDDLGLNLSNSSIGHEMVAILDDDVRNPIVLNDFFYSHSTTNSGTIEYPMNRLTDGPHRLFLRVWDVANNRSEATLDFIVDRGQINRLTHVSASPNPVSVGQSIRFTMTHQLSGVPIDVRISLFDVMGRLVSELYQQVTTGSNQIDNVIWDGSNYLGTGLHPGLYLYSIEATTTNAQGLSESAVYEGGKILLMN